MRRRSLVFVALSMVLWLRPVVPEAAPLRTSPPRVHIPSRPAGGPGVVTLVGQIVVMEGDDQIVTDLGFGDYGIDAMEAITQRFYMYYGDDFDGLAIFTSFPDQLQGGAAYALLIDHGFSGVGYPGGAGPQGFGSAGRLMSLVNMNDVGNYQNLDQFDSWYFTTMGQEFGHAWLAFTQFIDPVSGLQSGELLGRDGSHWSALYDADGSVMDGLDWIDNGNGTFTAGEFSVRYGPLDLYAMGVYAPEEVGPMYVLRNATYQDNGQAVGPTDHLFGAASSGRVVVADKAEFSIDDVIALYGPRVPAHDAQNEDFRMAFILVTRPGETADDVADKIAKLEVGRLTWEAKHREWTYNRSTMCTDVDAQCPLAFAQASDAVVSEDPDNSDGDGIIEPGERVRVDVTFTNDGAEAATTAVGEIFTTAEGVKLPEPATLPEIPVNGTIQHTFYLTIEGEACGVTIDLDITARIDHRTWRTSASFTPGIQDNVEPERFLTDAGWLANPTGTDDATNGAWAYGVPRATYFAGRELQPNGGADGGTDGAWFTGPTDSWDLGEVQGTTTLESATYDLSGVYAPTLQYKLWYLALDRTQNSLNDSPLEHLIVEASDDGGNTWVEVDRVGGERQRWAVRQAPLRDKIASTANVKFRFIVTDDRDATGRLVEVGIDDIAITSLSNACDADGDSGCCNIGRSDSGTKAGWLLLVLVVGLVLLRRRR